MNIKLIFSYDGSRFNGSQKQPEKNTVADAFLEIFKSMGIYTQFILSGRTDKNVHASMQVANIQLPPYWSDLDKLFIRLKKYLPSSIQLHSLERVSDDFHARFSAKKRVYRYFLSTENIDAFSSAYISQYNQEINLSLIQNGIKIFIGQHDFKNFSKKGSDPTNSFRTIFNAKFYKYKDYYIFTFKGNSFLRSQIRLMVMMLLELNEGKVTLADIKNQLHKKELKCKTLAPPFGLYLTKIIY